MSIIGTILNIGIWAEKVNDSNDWIPSPFAGQVASNSLAFNTIETKLSSCPLIIKNIHIGRVLGHI